MLGFVIAVIAGVLVPQIEQPLATPVVRLLQKHMPVDAVETRTIAFMIALLAAGILAALLDSGSAFGVIFGAVIGYFGLRIYAILKRIIEARSDPE